MSRLHYFGAITVMENLLKKKWSAVILRYFASGTNSPADLCSKEPDLSLPVLNERLRTMQRYNLIARSPARAQVPIQSYRLTPRGQRILQLLTVIEQFDQVEDISIQSGATGRFLIQVQLGGDPQPQNEHQPTGSTGG